MSSRSSLASRKPNAVEKLSNYDDICTDLLVDKVEFWSEIHKMGKHYKRKRKITDREVVDIIRSVAREKTTLSDAAEKIIKYIRYGVLLTNSLDGLNLYVGNMKAEDRADFSK